MNTNGAIAPILITGCARSGTSMVAGVVNMCGAFGGNMSGATVNNQKGMFENAHIRQNIVKPYLRDLGFDPMGQYPLPDPADLHIPANWRVRIERVMNEEGYSGGPWFYKGAKACLIWPVWHYAFPDAKWIIVRRKTPDIISSCVKTNFMRAFRQSANQRAVGAKTEQEGWLWWVHQHEKRFVEMIEAGLNVHMVWPERMVHNDFGPMMETIDWLRLKWNNDAISFVSPKLWKARRKEYALKEVV